MTIKSKYQKENLGGKLHVCANTILEYKPVPFSQGTKVTVEDLFFNTPVRKKSIQRKEKSNMVAIVKTLALANPNVTFQINEKTLPASSIHERIKQISGIDYFSEVRGDNFHIFFNKRNDDEKRKITLTFVNKRPVEIPEIKQLMEELNIGNYILFLTVPPEEIDVNVTPLKDKVFINNKKIFETIKEQLKPNVTLPTIAFVKEEKVEYKTEKIKLLGTDGTVIIGYDNEYYYFFDQHLIHERVNYEELIKKLKSGEISTVKLTQNLKLPYDKNLADKLKNIGVEFSVKDKQLIVTGIPEILNIEDINEIISGKSPESIASIACKKAIKSGHFPISTSQVEELFEKYLQCEEKEVCPHGRPIYTRIRRKKILKNLGR
ncbi:DNA mismatch repair protein MutL [Desulfurobacterium pacificum]|uniref:DNA mismatch repair protein MutL n=1 Tax=Desulfurobacterium pacificum TaxID=240166 RepID=A0ABY1NBW6_9BACT|nr:DNA mismatch repair protein MutL [Desulfurobacterium pacificum]